MSSWVGPGRGPETPIVFMYRADRRIDGPIALSILFEGYEWATIEDARVPHEIVIPVRGNALRVRPVPQ